MKDKDKIPESVRDYMKTIGRKGGESSKGTEAAKIRAMKGVEARLAKKAKLDALDPIPAYPKWIDAIQTYTQEALLIDPVEKARFNLLVGRAVAKNDMRVLGKLFEDVQRFVKHGNS